MDPCVIVWTVELTDLHSTDLCPVYCCFAVFFFFHTRIRLSFHCRIYSMNVVDSSISRPSSASPSGKPSGPAVSMGSVQGHYVQQVVYLSSCTAQKYLLHCCAYALGIIPSTKIPSTLLWLCLGLQRKGRKACVSEGPGGSWYFLLGR